MQQFWRSAAYQCTGTSHSSLKHEKSQCLGSACRVSVAYALLSARRPSLSCSLDGVVWILLIERRTPAILLFSAADAELIFALLSTQARKSALSKKKKKTRAKTTMQTAPKLSAAETLASEHSSFVHSNTQPNPMRLRSLGSSGGSASFPVAAAIWYLRAKRAQKKS
jgi:hypothetical protein